jgi:cytochrome c-type biogenesis protein CcmE
MVAKLCKSSLHGFAVADGNNAVRVVYAGSLPDLFREGQGVVAEGKLGRDGVSSRFRQHSRQIG